MYKWAYFGGHQGKGIPLGRELKQEAEHERKGKEALIIDEIINSRFYLVSCLR